MEADKGQFQNIFEIQNNILNRNFLFGSFFGKFSNLKNMKNVWNRQKYFCKVPLVPAVSWSPRLTDVAAIQNDGLVLVIIFMIKVTVRLTQMIVSFRLLEMDSM